jgi:hypothetical protein
MQRIRPGKFKELRGRGAHFIRKYGKRNKSNCKNTDTSR